MVLTSQKRRQIAGDDSARACCVRYSTYRVASPASFAVIDEVFSVMWDSRCAHGSSDTAFPQLLCVVKLLPCGGRWAACQPR